MDRSLGNKGNLLVYECQGHYARKRRHMVKEKEVQPHKTESATCERSMHKAQLEELKELSELDLL